MANIDRVKVVRVKRRWLFVHNRRITLLQAAFLHAWPLHTCVRCCVGGCWVVLFASGRLVVACVYDVYMRYDIYVEHIPRLPSALGVFMRTAFASCVCSYGISTTEFWNNRCSPYSTWTYMEYWTSWTCFCSQHTSLLSRYSVFTDFLPCLINFRMMLNFSRLDWMACSIIGLYVTKNANKII